VRRWISAGIGLWLSVSIGWAADRNPGLRVAAAASLRYAMEELVQAFRQRHPGAAVEVTYGVSGNFYAQILNRAPFDLFLSADVEYPRQVAAQGLALDRPFVYAVGRLVLWTRQGSPVDVEKLGMEALRHPAVRYVAVANPRLAPYGRAAVAALKHFGVYDGVVHKLVYGESVNQAAQFVQSGTADVGLLPLSMAVAAPMRAAGRYWVVPAEAHEPIEHAGVILRWARDPAAARAFRDLILSAEGQSILARHGFGKPASGSSGARRGSMRLAVDAPRTSP